MSAYGFHWLDLVTGAKHDHYCYSQPSPRGRGGILLTKARGLQRKGTEHFPSYLKQALDATGWTIDDVQHVIPHQVSVRAIGRGSRRSSASSAASCPTSSSAAPRTTATPRRPATSWRCTSSSCRSTIQPGHNVLLVSGASGIVISHATFTLDDLPERYRRTLPGGRLAMRRCRIESLGVSPPRGGRPRWGSLKHAVVAGRSCLADSRYRRADVRVLINAGVHRDGHVCEPAIAAYIQHGLGINIEFQGRRTTRLRPAQRRLRHAQRRPGR